jgi:hypothetical protein
MDLMVDRFGSSPCLISKLSCTCKAFHNAFPVPKEILDLSGWLTQQEAIDNSTVHYGQLSIFMECKITPKGHKRTWLLSSRCRRKSSQVFEHTGIINLNKYCASLLIMGKWSNCNVFKDSFYYIQDLDTLKRCLATHTFLCHEQVKDVPRLPTHVKHKHRDNIPWSWARAFYVWKATLQSKQADHQIQWCTSMIIMRGSMQITAVGRI